jgi:hypothetical protein
MQMNQDVKALWLAALRSGEFQQGKKRLRNMDDTYCCLGVLCELAVREGAIPPAVLDYVDSEAYTYGDHAVKHDTSRTNLPTPVANWAGITWDTHEVVPFVTLNDDENYTFEQIANEIESKL